MKPSGLAMLGLFATLGAAILIAQPDAPASKLTVPGRFQLVPARQSINAGGSKLSTLETLYRLDTCTGQAWRLNSRIANLDTAAPFIEEVWLPTLEDERTFAWLNGSPSTPAKPTSNAAPIRATP